MFRSGSELSKPVLDPKLFNLPDSDPNRIRSRISNFSDPELYEETPMHDNFQGHFKTTIEITKVKIFLNNTYN